MYDWRSRENTIYVLSSWVFYSVFQLETHILDLIIFYHQNIGSHLEIIHILRDWVYPSK